MTELKQSPLHERHAALGAKFAEFGGWSMPLQYASALAEHRAVREGVGIFDVSHLGKARVAGPGAKAFVNTCFTNDLDKVEPGQAVASVVREGAPAKPGSSSGRSDATASTTKTIANTGSDMLAPAGMIVACFMLGIGLMLTRRRA